LRETRGICERLANIPIFKIREVAEQVVDGPSGRERLDNHANSDAHAPDTWLSAHDFGISGYAAKLLHVVRIALNPACEPNVRCCLRENRLRTVSTPRARRTGVQYENAEALGASIVQ